MPISITQKIKYLCRKVECLAAIGKKSESQNLTEEVKALIQQDEVSNDLKYQTLQKLSGAFYIDYKNRKHDILVPKKESAKNTSSKHISCASDAVKFAYTPNYGLHLVAARNIQTGEILHNEEAYVTAPCSGNIYSHCSYCFNFAINGIPCEGCAYAIFCSDQCKQKALEKYHDIECKLISKVCFGNYSFMNQASNFNGLRLLCLRLFLKSFKEEGSIEALRDIVEDIKECKGIFKSYKEE